MGILTVQLVTAFHVNLPQKFFHLLKRRNIFAPRPLLCDLAMLSGFCRISSIKIKLCQEVVYVCLLQPVFAPVGDVEGFVCGF